MILIYIEDLPEDFVGHKHWYFMLYFLGINSAE